MKKNLIATLSILILLSTISACKSTSDSVEVNQRGSALLTTGLLVYMADMAVGDATTMGETEDPDAYLFDDAGIHVTGLRTYGDEDMTIVWEMVFADFKGLGVYGSETVLKGGAMSVTGAITITEVVSESSTSTHYIMENFTVTDGFFNSFSGDFFIEVDTSDTVTYSGSIVCNGTVYSMMSYNEFMLIIISNILNFTTLPSGLIGYEIIAPIRDLGDGSFTDMDVEALGRYLLTGTVSGTGEEEDLNLTISSGVVSVPEGFDGTFSYSYRENSLDNSIDKTMNASFSLYPPDEVHTLEYRSYSIFTYPGGMEQEISDIGGTLILDGVSYPADQVVHFAFLLNFAM